MGFTANDLTDADLNPVTHFKAQLGGDLQMGFLLQAPESARFRLERTGRSVRTYLGSLARRAARRLPGRAAR